MGLDNIRSVSNRYLFGFDLIHVKLHHPASFGDEFQFLAQTRVNTSMPWLPAPEHPIAKELRELAS
jgi:hypothetical protein